MRATIQPASSGSSKAIVMRRRSFIRHNDSATPCFAGVVGVILSGSYDDLGSNCTRNRVNFLRPNESSFIQIVGTRTNVEVAKVGVSAPGLLLADTVDNVVYGL